MTITTTQQALQTLNDSIVGIKAAPFAYPGSLNTADMPIAISWPAEGTATGTFGSNISQRIYTINVYVMPTQQGQGIDQGWQDCMTLLQRFVDKYRDSDSVMLVTGTYQSSIRSGTDAPIEDAGIQLLAYPPPATGLEGYPHYFGFQLRVMVKETWAQT